MVNDHGSVSMITLELALTGVKSLKQKRSVLSTLLSRLRKEFNVSVAEIARMDDWNTAIVGCVIVSNEGRYNQQVLSQVVNYISSHFPDIQLLSNHVENR
jgi:hypothetical protein